MTAALVTQSLEGRNPSPVSLSYQSDDDDMDEPWDEPARSPIGNQRSTSPFLACVEEYFDSSKDDDALEDGDLPSLRKSRNTPLLSGRTSTTKPLRPPSKLGLQVPSETERRQNSGRFSKQGRGVSPSSWEDDSEAPDDEMASLEMRGMTKKKLESQRRSDEHYDYPGVAPNESDDQFCDVTAMLSNICGESKTESPVRKATPAKRTLRSINDIPMDEDPIEEQTAIEIEYVEPDPKQKAASATSKKNSYLTAMARKAKAEFEKSVPEKTNGEEKKSEIVDEEENDTDVYSSFNATEKRKFLKMVNAGMTPTQSAKKVMEEREAASSPVASRRGLAFWKKPMPESSRSPRAPKDNVVAPVMVPPDDFANEYTKNLEVESSVVSKEDEYDQYEAAGFDSESESEDMESMDQAGTTSDAWDAKAPPRDTFIAVGPAPVAPAAVAAVVNKKMTVPTQPSVQEVLPKSGSNYYDAVRRDYNAEEHARRSALLEQKSAQVRASRAVVVRSPTGTISPAGNHVGFTQLNEQEENCVAAPATGTGETAEVLPGSASKRGNKASSLRRFKMRGIRLAGFAPVPENESPDRSHLNSSAAIGTSDEEEPEQATTDEATLAYVDEDAAVRDLLSDSAMDSSDDAYDDSIPLHSQVRAGELAVNTAIPEEEEATSFDIITPLSMAGSPHGRAVEVDGDQSVGLDTYMDSPSRYYSNNDQMSIVSGKSHWTAATGATNYTMSSRVRRPGAAKVRLENAKKADRAAITRQGWHESIKSAAAKSNQVWDPKEGFLDFEDSSVDPRGEESASTIHIELKGMKKRSAIPHVVLDDGKNETQPYNLASTSSAFDAESDDDIVWEEAEDKDEEIENEEIAVEEVEDFEDVEDEEDPHELQSEAEEDDSILNDSEDDQNMQRGIRSDVRLLSQSNSDEDDDSLLESSVAPAQPPLVESKGISSEARALPVLDDDSNVWVETMKVASAKYARNGATWDPETGWQGVKEEGSAPNSPIVKRTGVDPPVSPSVYNRSQAPDPDGVRHAVVEGGDVTLAGALVANQSHDSTDISVSEGGMKPEAPLEDLENDEEGVRSRGLLFSMDPASAGLGDRLRPPSQASRSIGDADTITTTQDEKYIQIGDTGSVRSFTYNQSPADSSVRRKEAAVGGLESPMRSTRDVGDPVMDQESTAEGDTAPLLLGDNFIRAADHTEVVKLKNTEDDISLFAHDSRNSFPKVDVLAQTAKGRGLGPVDLDEIEDFKRRGQGPVDIDEIDDMDFDDDDDDEAWASAQIGSSPAVPSAIRASTMKKSAQVSPPKIKAPEKDTTSLRHRQRGSRGPRGDPHGIENARGGSFRASELLPELAPRDPNEVWNAAYGRAEDFDEHPEASRDPGGMNPNDVWNAAYGHDEDTDQRHEALREDPRGIKNLPSASMRASEVEGGPSPDTERSSVVKNLARQWESRAAGISPMTDRAAVQESPRSPRMEDSRPSGDKHQETSPTDTAEWKSFLESKALAESAAAAKMSLTESSRPDPSEIRKRPDPSESRRGKEPVGGLEDELDDDSLFEFKPSMRDETGAFPTAAQSTIDEVDDSFSDISPIQAREDEYDDDDSKDMSRNMEAVSDTGTNIEQGSFFKRLQACAAPMMPRSYSHTQSVEGESVPSSHLAFLRSPPQSGGALSSTRFISPNLCARPDTISEEVEALPSPIATARSSSSKRSKQRASPRYGGSELRSPLSDDGFGAKTSYLESLAMEAAVSKPKRHGSRGRASDEKSRSSNTSDVSATSRRSEKWQEFVDRKSIGLSPEKRRGESSAGFSDQSSEVSKAAERYAARQVEEMLEAMSKRREGERYVDDMVGQSTGGVSPNAGRLSPYDMKGVRSDGSRTVRSVQTKNESVRAAEELAAARVEAMMAAMTSQSLDLGEI